MISVRIYKTKRISHLVVAQFLSQIGEKMLLLGVVWQLVQTSSASIVSIALGSAAIPHLIFFYYAGRWSKKWGFARTIMNMDIYRAVLFLAIGIVFEKSFSESASFLIAVLFLTNIFGAFYNTSLFALPKELIRNNDGLLQQVTAILDSSVGLSLILGSAFSVVVYQYIGIQGLFLANGVMHLIAAALERVLTLKEAKEVSSLQPEEHAESLISLVKKSSILKVLGSFLLMNLFLSPLIILLPLFTKDIFHGDFKTLLKLEIALASGSLLGTLLLAVKSWRVSLFTKCLIACSSVSILFLAFTFSTNENMASVMLAFLGFGLAVANVAILNWFQNNSPAGSLGFSMSAVNFILSAATPLAMIGLGQFLQHFELQKVAQVCAVGLIISTVLMLGMIKFPSQKMELGNG
ncbi:MAG: MFS transporter [Bdellovibrionota bacterium]